MVGQSFPDVSCYQVCWETGVIWSNGNKFLSPDQFLWKIFTSLNNFLAFKVSLYKVCAFETYLLSFFHFHLSTFAAKIKRKGSWIFSAVFHLRICLVMNAVVYHCTLFFNQNCSSHMSVNCPLGKLCPCPDMNVLAGELRAIWSKKVQTK